MSSEIVSRSRSISLQVAQSLPNGFPDALSVTAGIETALISALNRLMSSSAGGKAYDSVPFELERIRDTILTYLAASPTKLGQHGVSWDDPAAIGELLLNLGKALKWMSPAVDGHGRENTNAGPARGDKARSVLELGEQFRLLGLQYLNASDRAKEFSAQEVRRRLIALESRFAPGGGCAKCKPDNRS